MARLLMLPMALPRAGFFMPMALPRASFFMLPMALPRFPEVSGDFRRRLSFGAVVVDVGAVVVDVGRRRRR